ncbi:MAG TPA: ABC transporter permease subunit [Magnetospirillaceae bacterium]
MIGLLILWQVLAMTVFAGAHVLPGPIAIAKGLWSDRTYYAANILPTVIVAAKGYVFGNLIAIVLALIGTVYPPTEGPIMRVALVAYGTPLLAVAPILVVICSGDAARVILAALSVFFTTLVGVQTGLLQADATSLDVITAYGGRRWSQLFKVRLWSCLPSLFAALKIAAPSSLLGAIIAEFLGADRGLGIGLVVAEQNLDSVRTWGIAVVATAIAGVAYGIVDLIGQWSMPWLSRSANRS